MTPQAKRVITALTVGVLGLLVGCEEPVQIGEGGGRGFGSRSGRGRGAQAREAAQETNEEAPAEPEFAPSDDAFVEVDIQNRDPFRGYAQMFKVRNVQPPQRRVLLPTLSIEQMRLKAIISGVPQPVAQIVDQQGVGHTIRRGDFIGRPEVIQTGGVDGVTVLLNWRVDRIRPNEVVLTREDPNAPDQLPLTRIIPLHDERELLGSGARP
jgi:type IV pilus assembly protein PilP